MCINCCACARSRTVAFSIPAVLKWFTHMQQTVKRNAFRVCVCVCFIFVALLMFSRYAHIRIITRPVEERTLTHSPLGSPVVVWGVML